MYPIECPDAIACIRGGQAHPGIRGTVKFFRKRCGTLVEAKISGLPETGFFGFHIHEGKDCGGEDLSDSEGHFNPTSAAHPNHAGDLPVLLESSGRAYLQVFTGRFRVEDVIGRTVIIHGNPDDFRSQPSGDSGMKIACGVIRRA